MDVEVEYHIESPSFVSTLVHAAALEAAISLLIPMPNADEMPHIECILAFGSLINWFVGFLHVAIIAIAVRTLSPVHSMCVYTHRMMRDNAICYAIFEHPPSGYGNS